MDTGGIRVPFETADILVEDIADCILVLLNIVLDIVPGSRLDLDIHLVANLIIKNIHCSKKILEMNCICSLYHRTMKKCVQKRASKFIIDAAASEITFTLNQIHTELISNISNPKL